ncbi:hypothetical protein PRIEUP_LOCUS14883 [Pristimantis euphronides]
MITAGQEISQYCASEFWRNHKIRIMHTNANTPSVVIVQHGNPQSNQPMASLQEESSFAPNVPKPFMKFFKGEPEVLGVTQLIIGINHIFFGIILTNFCYGQECFYLRALVGSGVLFWSGIMVKASLVLNILSSITAMISVIIFVKFYIFISLFRYYNDKYIHCAYYKPNQTCEVETIGETLYAGIVSTLFLLTVLEFCIALSTSIFGCKTVCKTSYNDVAVVIYQTTSYKIPNISQVHCEQSGRIFRNRWIQEDLNKQLLLTPQRSITVSFLSHDHSRTGKITILCFRILEESQDQNHVHQCQYTKCSHCAAWQSTKQSAYGISARTKLVCPS